MPGAAACLAMKRRGEERIIKFLIGVLIGATATACSSGASTGGASSRSTSSPRPPITGAAKPNPVVLLHKLPVCKTDPNATVGDWSPWGNYATCWYTAKDPFNRNPDGSGGGEKVELYATGNQVSPAVIDPEDHQAVLVGNGWMALVNPEIPVSGPYTFRPSPAVVASQLGGKVYKVWP